MIEGGFFIQKIRIGRALFCASAGGHLTELLQLSPLIEEFNGVVLTEDTPPAHSLYFPTVFVPYSSRQEGVIYLFKYAWVSILSFYYFFKFNPKVIISTGVHSTLPIAFLGWLFRRHVIYIETIANVKTPTLSGRLMKRLASEFYIQWEELMDVYPQAKVGRLF